jgi:tetratricopeptide (TPR) repeat protein
MSRRSKKKAPAVPSSAPASLKPESRPAGLSDRWTVIGVCLFLAAIIWVVFGQTLGHEFFNCDDDDYVYQNPIVQKGLTLRGIVWAFTHVCAFNWHPLTGISHMLDCQLYGLNPGGHHLTNVLLHTAAAILLFLVLRRMTGFLWRSAFVAAVFAIHPLRVESVAWVAERKDVLSGLFFMLTLGAYVRYVEKSEVQLGWGASRRPKSKVWYGLTLLFFALGLMSKPMLVTLPFVLLLLDYWPLNRFGLSTLNSGESRAGPQLSTKRVLRLLLEKIPFFVLSAASCVVTIFAQHEAIQSFENLSLPMRVGNALISYAAYLGQMFWPAGLAVLYPFTARSVGVSEVVLSVVVLAGISTGVLVLRRRPYLLTGWLWYLIMLVPVIGIVQVGVQARADRYTYLPQIGMYLLLTWAAAELCAGWRHRRVVLGGCATVILVALIFCARVQASYWRNSESLWTHTLACTSDNYTAHNNLGDALFQKGRVDEAIAHFQQALQIYPDYAEAHYNLGCALLQKGNVDEAIVQYQKTLQINPNYAKAHINLGNVLLKMGNVDEAIVQYQKALQIEPDNTDAHNNLGSALLTKGRMDEAIVQYQKALQIEPDYAKAQNNLAWVLATCPQASLRNGNEAVALAQRANQLTGDGNPVVLGTLAIAYAEAGRFPEAVETAQRALQLAETQSNTALADAIRSQLKLYQAGIPFHSH